LPAIESWSFENHNPELAERAAELENFGITRQLGELFDVFISRGASTGLGVDPPNGIRIISARDLRPNGNIDLARGSVPQRAAARSVRLARGDILIRSIATAPEQMCACVVSDDHLPAEAGPNIMVLRAK